MMGQLPRISIGIITYNQERLIGRALDSLLCQKDYIYEIVVCDDCSTDNNWSVISEYASKYPDLIKAVRNETNMYIWKNQHKVMNLLTGDLLKLMAGDDTVEPDLCRKVVEFVQDSKIDYTKGKFCIYLDWQYQFPDGRKQVNSNYLVTSGHSMLSLKLRTYIWNRTSFESRELQQTIKEARSGIGIHADFAWEMQTQANSEVNYYIPYVGSTYFCQIGVSKTTPKEKEVKSFVMAMDDVALYFEPKSKDYYYTKYLAARTLFGLQKSFRAYLDMVKYNILSYDRDLPAKKHCFRQFIGFTKMLLLHK